MGVSIGKGVTIYKSVSAGKGIGTGAVSNPSIIGFVTAQVQVSAAVQLFRTQYIVASAISSVRTKMPIPVPITTNSRSFMFSMNSKYQSSGPQDVSASWTGSRDSGFVSEYVSNSSVAFTRCSALTAGTLSSCVAGLGFIEYLGATGGAHDIQSLIRFVATLVTGQDTLSTTLPIIPNDPNDVVPFLSSMMTDQGAVVPKTVYAYMSGLDDLNVVFRSVSSTTQARHAYINAVEFVGNAWTVRHCFIATSNAVSANVNVMTAPLGAGVTAAVDWGHTMVIPMQAIQGSSKAQSSAIHPHLIYPIICPVDSSTAAVVYNTEAALATFNTASETVGYLITNAQMSVLRVDCTAQQLGWKKIDMSGNSPGSASACWAIMQAHTSASSYPHGCYTTLQISDTTVAFYSSNDELANTRQHLQVASLPRG